ncbi:MAG: DUF1254 domain-containing protein [Dehalococcoidia bacterium]|nr:DUF1254 domain-containing protein [Dehalococcoidia bacterium]
MKKLMPWIGWTLLAIIVVAAIVNLIVAVNIPTAIMEATINKKFNYPSNQWIFEAPVTDNSTDVVRPAPDDIYSICVYDVSQHPLRVTSMTTEYWTISAFAMNTDNFFNLTSSQAKTNPVEIILVSRDMTYEDPTGRAQVVTAQSDKGILMITMVIPNQDALPGILKIQKQTTAELVE